VKMLDPWRRAGVEGVRACWQALRVVSLVAWSLLLLVEEEVFSDLDSR
jgi:hypothetical protein